MSSIHIHYLIFLYCVFLDGVYTKYINATYPPHPAWGAWGVKLPLESWPKISHPPSIPPGNKSTSPDGRVDPGGPCFGTNLSIHFLHPFFR